MQSSKRVSSTQAAVGAASVSPAGTKRSTRRIAFPRFPLTSHLDDFWQLCARELRPWVVIDGQIKISKWL